jgi:hypothetical protein
MTFILLDFPLSLTRSESPRTCKSCGPNALLLTIPSYSIQSLELLQQEHSIFVIPILIDYLWTEHIPGSKIWLIVLKTFPWLIKFFTWFVSCFLMHSVLQGEIVGFSPTLFYVAPSSIVVQVTEVTDLPRGRELWTHEFCADVLWFM